MEFKNNSKAAKEAIRKASIQYLLAACMVVEAQVAVLVKTDTNRLKNSISYTVDEDELVGYVGSNVFYSVYVEFGTGEFAENGQGRAGYWVYVPDGESGSLSQSTNMTKTYTLQEAKQIMAMMRRKGIDAHISNGMQAQPFLRPAFRQEKARLEDLAAQVYSSMI